MNTDRSDCFQWEQSDLCPYYLQYRLPEKNMQNERAEVKSSDWQLKGKMCMNSYSASGVTGLIFGRNHHPSS